ADSRGEGAAVGLGRVLAGLLPGQVRFTDEGRSARRDRDRVDPRGQRADDAGRGGDRLDGIARLEIAQHARARLFHLLSLALVEPEGGIEALAQLPGREQVLPRLAAASGLRRAEALEL